MDMETVMLSLQLMWKGMLAIFVVIFAIFMIVSLLLKLTGNKKESTDQQP